MKKKQQADYHESILHGFEGFPLGIHHQYYPSGSIHWLYSHWHDEYEIFYLIKGNLRFLYNQECFEIHAGDIVFISPEIIHGAEALDADGFEFIALVFKESFIANIDEYIYSQYVLPLFNRHLCPPRLVIPSEPWYSQLKSLIEDIAQWNASTEPEQYIQIKSSMLKIWALYFKHSRKETASAVHPTHMIEQTKKVMDYIDEHYTEHITLEQLASIIHVCPPYLNRIFKEILHISPIAYLRRKRIEQSYYLLINTNKKISDIAGLCGFDNLSNFNRAFVQILHTTPKEIRKMRAESD